MKGHADLKCDQGVFPPRLYSRVFYLHKKQPHNCKRRFRKSGEILSLETQLLAKKMTTKYAYNRQAPEIKLVITDGLSVPKEGMKWTNRNIGASDSDNAGVENNQHILKYVTDDEICSSIFLSYQLSGSVGKHRFALNRGSGWDGTGCKGYRNWVVNRV